MTIGELREMLEDYDDDYIVVLAKDGEGNGFSDDVTITVECWDGEEIGLLELTKELAEEGYTEEDVSDGQPCIVIWP